MGGTNDRSSNATHLKFTIQERKTIAQYIFTQIQHRRRRRRWIVYSYISWSLIAFSITFFWSFASKGFGAIEFELDDGAPRARAGRAGTCVLPPIWRAAGFAYKLAKSGGSLPSYFPEKLLRAETCSLTFSSYKSFYLLNDIFEFWLFTSRSSWSYVLSVMLVGAEIATSFDKALFL